MSLHIYPITSPSQLSVYIPYNLEHLTYVRLERRISSLSDFYQSSISFVSILLDFVALYAMTLFEEPGADYTVNGLILFPVRDGSGAYCLARHGCCTWGSLGAGLDWTGMELAVKE
jgi:hypothetical protein